MKSFKTKKIEKKECKRNRYKSELTISTNFMKYIINIL